MMYIGTKLVEAEPARRCWVKNEFFIHKEGDEWTAKELRMMKNPLAKVEKGYQVRYQDGYVSWCPAEVFEKANLPLTVNPKLKTDAPSISQEMVEGFVREYQVETMGDKCTVVRAILRNGFEIVESSACVSAENYDEALGAEICKKKIRDQVWFLLGFLLQTAVHGVGEEAYQAAEDLSE